MSRYVRALPAMSIECGIMYGAGMFGSETPRRIGR